MGADLLIAGAIVFLAGVLFGIVIALALLGSRGDGDGGEEPDEPLLLYPPPEWTDEVLHS